MGCRGFDNLVLLEYNLRKLDADEDRRVRLHLEHCEDCRAALSEMTPMATAMTATRKATEFDLNEDSARKIMAAGRIVLTGFRPIPLAQPDGAAAPVAAPAAPPPTVAIPVTPAWIPTAAAHPSAAAVPVAVPLNGRNPHASAIRRSGAGRHLWAMPLGAVAAGIAAALVFWVMRPIDPWNELNYRLTDGSRLAELYPAVMAAARAEVQSDSPEAPVMADLEYAAWICSHAGDEGQRETVVRLLSGVAGRRMAGVGRGRGTGGGLFESVAEAAPASVAQSRKDVLQKAWSFRSQKTPLWREAAAELQAASDAEAVAADRAAFRMMASLYLWEAGQVDAALQRLRIAAERDNALWLPLAYLYRWGLGNDHMAQWAFLHHRNLATLTAEAKLKAFAGLPQLIFPGEYESTDGVNEDDWYRSSYGSSAFTAGEEAGRRILRQTEVSADPADWLTRLRHYDGRESNYTVQLDFRFDEAAPADAEGGPWLGVYGYWSQQERNYRLVIRPDSVQFSKRRPPLPGEILDKEHFVEYLLPAGGGKPLASAIPVGTWYSAKFRLQNRSGATRLSAKVWPRNAREPAEWMLDQVDAGIGAESKYPPFTAGRTGLTVSRAAMSFDNVLVSAN